MLVTCSSHIAAASLAEVSVRESSTACRRQDTRRPARATTSQYRVPRSPLTLRRAAHEPLDGPVHDPASPPRGSENAPASQASSTPVLAGSAAIESPSDAIVPQGEGYRRGTGQADAGEAESAVTPCQTVHQSECSQSSGPEAYSSTSGEKEPGTFCSAAIGSSSLRQTISQCPTKSWTPADA